MYDQSGMTGDEQDQTNYNTQQDPFGFGFGFEGFWGDAFHRASYNAGETKTKRKKRYAEKFEDIFVDFDEFYDNTANRAPRGQDIQLTISITLEEAVKGVHKEVLFTKQDNCDHCLGTKSEPGYKSQKCGTCNGKGTTKYRQGPFKIKTVCFSCQGSGQVITHPCTECNAAGISEKQQREKIKVPKGANHGDKIRLNGKVQQNKKFPASYLKRRVMPVIMGTLEIYSLKLN